MWHFVKYLTNEIVRMKYLFLSSYIIEVLFDGKGACGYAAYYYV